MNIKVGEMVEVSLKGKVVGYLPCGHVVVKVDKGKNPTKILIGENTIGVPPKNIISK